MSVKFGRILKGSVLSVLISLLTMVAITVLSYFCDINAKVIDVLMVIGLALGCMSSAFFVAKASEGKYGIYGLSIGLFMLILFFVFSFFVNGKLILNAHSVSIICVCLLSGFLGGVFGR